MTYLEIIKLWRFDSYGPFFLSGFQDNRIAFFGCGSWLQMGKSAWSHWPALVAPLSFSVPSRVSARCGTTGGQKHAEKGTTCLPMAGQGPGRVCGAGGTAGPLRGRGRRPLRVLQGENKWICSTVNRNNWTSISSAPNFSIRRPIWLNF